MTVALGGRSTTNDGCYPVVSSRKRENKGLWKGVPGGEAVSGSWAERSEPLVVTDAVVGHRSAGQLSFLFALSRPLPPTCSSHVCDLVLTFFFILLIIYPDVHNPNAALPG